MLIRQRIDDGPLVRAEEDIPRACEVRNSTARPGFKRWCPLLLCSFLFLPAQTYGRETLWPTDKAVGSDSVEQGRYEEAESRLRAAIAEAEKFGSLDPRLADSLNQLAILYATQRKFTQAEPLFQRSLGVSVAALGPDHPDVAIVLRNMGILKASMRNYAEADVLLSRSLSLTNRALGQEHPVVAVTMRTIAVCQAVQGH